VNQHDDLVAGLLFPGRLSRPDGGHGNLDLTRAPERGYSSFTD
jgi:hypothetical protein